MYVTTTSRLFLDLRLDFAGWLEKLECNSDVLAGLISIDLEYLTVDHLYAAQIAVLQCLSDIW